MSVAANSQKKQLAAPGHSHDVHGDGGSQALADLLEEVVGGEHVGAARNQVLLELQQLRASTQKDLRRNAGA